MRVKFFMVAIFAISTAAYSQIKVATNNNVGIGVDAPVAKFSIGGVGNSYNTMYLESPQQVSYGRTLQVKNPGHTGSWGYCIIGTTLIQSNSATKNVGIRGSSYSTTSLSTKRSYGVWGQAGNCTSGWNYGVFGVLYGSNNGAAVYGLIPGRYENDVAGVWAGYFNGDVNIQDELWVDGVQITSDIALKKEIRALKNESISQLEKIKSLNSIKYKLKTPNEISETLSAKTDTTVTVPGAVLQSDKYTKDKIGLSAQEVQAVYPELVKEDSRGYLSVNYIGLVPVLVEAIKEQDELLQKQEGEIAELRALVEGLLSTEKQ